MLHCYSWGLQGAWPLISPPPACAKTSGLSSFGQQSMPLHSLCCAVYVARKVLPASCFLVICALFWVGAVKHTCCFVRANGSAGCTSALCFLFLGYMIRFRPTQEWLDNLRSEIPFNTILRLLHNLAPQVRGGAVHVAQAANAVYLLSIAH